MTPGERELKCRLASQSMLADYRRRFTQADKSVNGCDQTAL
jgi:hypothetical protein